MAVVSVNQFVGYVMCHTVAITNYVGGSSNPRIFNGNIPETITAKPVINYMIVGKPRQLVHGIYRTHFQINVRHTSPEIIWTLSELVIDAFDNYQGTADGYDVQCGYFENSNMFPEPNNSYCVPLDIYITHKGV